MAARGNNGKRASSPERLILYYTAGDFTESSFLKEAVIRRIVHLIKRAVKSDLKCSIIGLELGCVAQFEQGIYVHARSRANGRCVHKCCALRTQDLFMINREGIGTLWKQTVMVYKR